MSTPSADVRLRVAANSAASQFAMMSNQMKRMMADMKRGTQQTNQEAKKANKTFGDWAGGIGKSVGGLMAMSAAMTGIYSVGRLITQQFAEQAQFAKDARERQIPAQDLAKRFYFESIPSSVKDPEGFFGKVNQMVKDSSVQDKSNLWRLLQTTMSTMGNVEPMERIKFGLSVAEGRRDLMNMAGFQQLNTFAGVAGMAHLTFADEGSTADAQMGLMQKTITSSAVSDMTSFARNIAPVGNKLKIQGANQVEALGLAAALSTLFNDQTGQLVDTAANNIAGKMSMAEKRFGIDTTGKSFLERQAFVRSNDPKAKQLREYILASFANDAEELTDQDRAMMSQAELNKALAPKLGGRAKTLFGAMQFFQPAGTADGKGELNDLFKSAIKEIGGVYKKENVIDVQATYKNVAEQYKQQMEFVSTNQAFRAANEAMTTKEANESILQAKDNPIQAELGELQTDFDRLMRSSGKSYYRRALDSTRSYVFGSGETYEQSLERMGYQIEEQLATMKAKARRRVDEDGNSVPSKFLGELFGGKTKTIYVYENEEQKKVVEVLEAKLSEVVQQLDAIRRQQPKPIKIDPSEQVPEKPKATEIGQ